MAVWKTRYGPASVLPKTPEAKEEAKAKDPSAPNMVHGTVCNLHEREARES